jgi:hypothetical protein
MQFVILLPAYVRWHYGRAIREYIGVAENILWFLWNVFSISLLSRTLLARFKRMGEPYKKGFDIGEFFSSLIVNIMMRLVGFVMRLSVIVVGLAVIMCSLALGLVVFICWLLLPIIVVGLFLFGLYNITVQS